jgi:outer membrane protein assembly factor BamA
MHSIPWRGDRIVFGTAVADLRRYRRWNVNYSLATRILVAYSFGEDPQQFQVGGPWTLRGHHARALVGRSTAQTGVEFRYPFLERITFGWPLRSTFGGVRGALFVDAATAFDEVHEFRFREMSRLEGSRGLRDVKMGFGTGIRFGLLSFPIRLDVAWPTDLARVGEPVWHLTVGPEP